MTTRIEEMVEEFERLEEMCDGDSDQMVAMYRRNLRTALTEAHQAGIDEGVMEENNRIREEYELLAGENPTMSYDKIFKKAIKR